MNEAYEFSIAKGRFAILLASSALIGALLFAAGLLTGLMVYPRTEMARRLRPATPAAASVALVEAAAKPPQKAAPAAPTPAAAAPAPTAAPTAAPAIAPTTASTTASGGAGRLAIQVGSFREKTNADKLAHTLEREGYGPVTLATAGSASATWHVVRLGPYPAWDTASRIAAEIEQTYDIQAFIRPLEAAAAPSGGSQ